MLSSVITLSSKGVLPVFIPVNWALWWTANKLVNHSCTCYISDNTTNTFYRTPRPPEQISLCLHPVFNHLFLWIKLSRWNFCGPQESVTSPRQRPCCSSLMDSAPWWTNSGFFCSSQLCQSFSPSCGWMRFKNKTVELTSFYFNIDVQGSNMALKEYGWWVGLQLFCGFFLLRLWSNECTAFLTILTK